jgi:hypothetical protein
VTDRTALVAIDVAERRNEILVEIRGRVSMAKELGFLEESDSSL